MADPIATQAPPAVSTDRTAPPPAPPASGTQPVAMAASDALSPEEAHRRMVDRIEDALTRIDIATRNRADALTTLEQRHDVLRDQMTRAIAALDTVLAAADAADTAEAAADDVDEGDA